MLGKLIMKTLKEIYNEHYNNENAQFIALQKQGDDPENIIIDYADEFLETHGDIEVVSSRFIVNYNCLVVEYVDKEDKEN